MRSTSVFRVASVACALCALAPATAASARLPRLPVPELSPPPQAPVLPERSIEDALDRVVGPITDQLPGPVSEILTPADPAAPPAAAPAPSGTPSPPAGTVGEGGATSVQGEGSRPASPTRTRPLQGAPPTASSPAGQERRTSVKPRRRARDDAGEVGIRPASSDAADNDDSFQDGVREIVEVIPGWARGVVGALATLALGFGALLLITRHRAHRLERHRQQLMGDLGTLQEALLPDVPDSLGGLDVSVAYRPAEGLAAGGDFYDAFELQGGRVGVIVGDVAGHGREALKQTAVLHYTLRAYLEADMEPRAALQVTASTLARGGGERHATAVVAVYEPDGGRLTYATAGHPPPILVGAEHEPVTAFSSPPLGLGLNAGIRQTTITIPEGAAICFFTDGLEDARVGELTLGRESLNDLIADLGPEADAPAVVAAVMERATRAEDDIAVCVLRQTRPVRRSGACEEHLILDSDDVHHPDAERFLVACGVNQARVDEVLEEARAMVVRSRAVVLWTMRSAHGAEVEVLPAGGPGLPPETHPPLWLTSAA